jgi:glycosyltransferase involved in cell wall biosynthesis
MRLLFAHDHRIFSGADGQFYSAGSLPASVWERYLRHFDALHVIARDGGAVPEVHGLSVTSSPPVTFEFLPNLTSLRHLLLPSREIDRRIEQAILGVDAVLARLPSEIGLRAATIARRLGKPYAIEAVGCAYDGYGNSGFTAARFYAPIALARMRAAISKAPLVLYVTSRWLQQRYPSQSRRSSVSDVEIVPLPPEAEAAREARLASLVEGRLPRLGTIASLRIKSKGVQTAIAALSVLRKQGLDLHYDLLGSGDLDDWKSLASEFGVSDLVHFNGTRDAGEGVRCWLDGIDIHLQPSFQEGLPRATVEAMSRGVACIGSTCGGIPELLPPHRTHEPGDVEGLAERIQRLATDPAAVAAASHVDRVKASQFLPDKLQSRRDEFYLELRRMAESSTDPRAAA